jgi:hypothetical protein
MSHIRELFQSKIEALLEKVPLVRRPEAEKAIDAVLASAPRSDDKAVVGKYVGPRLKEVEKTFVPPEASLSKEEKLGALHQAKAVDDARLHQLIGLLGEPGVGRAIEAARSRGCSA